VPAAGATHDERRRALGGLDHGADDGELSLDADEPECEEDAHGARGGCCGGVAHCRGVEPARSDDFTCPG